MNLKIIQLKPGKQGSEVRVINQKLLPL